MHHGLLCQTDETPDARELYTARLEACEDCLFLVATRGAPVAVPLEDEAGDLTWLVQAALGGDDQQESRRRPPMAAAPGAARKLPRQQG